MSIKMRNQNEDQKHVKVLSNEQQKEDKQNGRAVGLNGKKLNQWHLLLVAVLQPPNF